MRLKYLNQLPRENNVNFSACLHNTPYRRGNAFSLEDVITRFVLELQATIQTIVVHNR